MLQDFELFIEVLISLIGFCCAASVIFDLFLQLIDLLQINFGLFILFFDSLLELCDFLTITAASLRRGFSKVTGSRRYRCSSLGVLN